MRDKTIRLVFVLCLALAVILTLRLHLSAGGLSSGTDGTKMHSTGTSINGLYFGSESFVGTANADTTTITGIGASSRVFAFCIDPLGGGDVLLGYKVSANTLIVRRGASGTSGASYSYFIIE